VSAEDAIRNGIGAAALAGLGELAAWRGDGAAAARYAAMASSIRAAMLASMLRVDAGAGEAFFVDGAPGGGVPNSTAHAAVHSTLYAVAGAGAADVAVGDAGDTGVAGLACRLAAYLARRDTGGASCMTARWHLEALFRLGVQCGTAADAAVDLLARETYPSWRFMMTNASATMTLEAWAPGDKWSKWPARFPTAALPQEARSAPRAR